MGVELGIKPWGVSTESPLPMGFREGLKVGLGRGRQVSLSELRELVMDREACRAAIYGVAKSRT